MKRILVRKKFLLHRIIDIPHLPCHVIKRLGMTHADVRVMLCAAAQQNFEVIVMQSVVRVDKRQILSCRPDAGVSRMAGIYMVISYDTESLIPLCEFSGTLYSPIVRTVVNNDNFEIRIGLHFNALQTFIDV